MAKGLVTNTHLTNIGNAIRNKLGVQTTYKPSQMAAAIASIPSGGSDVIDLSTGVKFGYSTFSTLPNQIANADWSTVTYMSNMFAHSSITTLPIIDTSNVTNMRLAFNACNGLTAFPLLDTSKVTDMYYMFEDCQYLTTVAQLNTSNVRDMMGMFIRCYRLTEIPQFSTSNVTNMQQMFSSCSALTTVPQLDTSKLTGAGMYRMFSGCSALSNESLNNILAMCTNATLITNANYKTLAWIGLTSGQAAACESLSNWSAFVAAGWASGY